MTFIEKHAEHHKKVTYKVDGSGDNDLRKEKWFLHNAFICVAQNISHAQSVRYSIRRIADFENLAKVELKNQKKEQDVFLEVGKDENEGDYIHKHISLLIKAHCKIQALNNISVWIGEPLRM